MAEMNFLELVQRAYQESGLTGTPPASVLNQTGRKADMVRWVQQANEDIHLFRDDWNFDWSRGSFPLSAADDTYSPTSDFGVAGGVRKFAEEGAYCVVTASGINSRLWLHWMPWERFRYMPVPPVSGSPALYFTLKPDGDVQYYPVPAAAITAVHEYWRNPQELAADADEPRIPGKFHMAIVWRAVMISCEKTKDWSRFDSAEEEYLRVRSKMLDECTPRITLGGALA
jgi:hypothetical protein